MNTGINFTKKNFSCKDEENVSFSFFSIPSSFFLPKYPNKKKKVHFQTRH